MRVTATRLNVRSGPGQEFRIRGQLGNGAVVAVAETHGDWAWVDPGEGWVHRAYLEQEGGLLPPAPGEIDSVFGEPCSKPCGAGRVDLPAALKLGWENASVTRVACHELMVPVFSAVFNEIHSAGLWGLLATFDGIYNCRNIKGRLAVSTHSYGISVDLNAATNRQGGPGDMDPRIVEIFERHGFYWGGRFKGGRRDDMHFEFVRRP